MTYISAAKVKKEGETIALIFGGDLNDEGTVCTLNLETMKSGPVDNVRY